MSHNAAYPKDWTQNLPPLRGRIRVDAPLGDQTWFRVGGKADLLFRPADEADLADFLRAVPLDVPVTVIGVGSNLLVRDGGVRGAVIRLGGPFVAVEVLEPTLLRAGAGALDLTVAQTAQAQGLGGMEFLSGVPGTIGGALRMNAGAFGGEMKDITRQARVMNRLGQVQTHRLEELHLSYRHCGLPDGVIFLDAQLEGQPAEAGAIQARMDSIRQTRDQTQPTHVRTGGSTFANPPGARAWELIDRAGCRGLRRGGAQVSEKHCNFLLNDGNATAADIEELGEEVRRRVLDTSGIELRWEIRRIGEAVQGETP